MASSPSALPLSFLLARLQHGNSFFREQRETGTKKEREGEPTFPDAPRVENTPAFAIL